MSNNSLKVLRTIRFSEFLDYIAGKKLWAVFYYTNGEKTISRLEMICYKIEIELICKTWHCTFYNNEGEADVFCSCKEVQQIEWHGDQCYKMSFEGVDVFVWEKIPDFKMRKKFQ